MLMTTKTEIMKIPTYFSIMTEVHSVEEQDKRTCGITLIRSYILSNKRNVVVGNEVTNINWLSLIL